MASLANRVIAAAISIVILWIVVRPMLARRAHRGSGS